MKAEVISFRPGPIIHERIMAECDWLGISVTEFMIRKLASVDTLKQELLEVKEAILEIIDWAEENGKASVFAIGRLKRLADSIDLPKKQNDE